MQFLISNNFCPRQPTLELDKSIISEMSEEHFPTIGKVSYDSNDLLFFPSSFFKTNLVLARGINADVLFQSMHPEGFISASILAPG